MPTPSFLNGVKANLEYWQVYTRDADPGYKALDADRHNLYRAVQAGLSFPDTQPAATQLALELFSYIELGSYWREWMMVLDRALALESHPAPVRCRLLNQSGFLHMHTRQFSEALRAHEAAKEMAAQGEMLDELAEACFGLCQVYYFKHAYAEAESYGQRALETYVQTGSLKKQGNVHNILGMLAHVQGKYALAEAHLEKTLELHAQTNSPRRAHYLNNLALTYQAQEKYEHARQCFLEALALVEDQSQPWIQNNTLNSLGTLYFAMDRYRDAETTFLAIDAAFLHRIGNLVALAQRANNLGQVYLKQKRLEEAERALRHALTLWQQTEDRINLANTLGSLAEVLVLQENFSQALLSYEEAIPLFSPFLDNAWARGRQSRLEAQKASLVTRLQAQHSG